MRLALCSLLLLGSTTLVLGQSQPQNSQPNNPQPQVSPFALHGTIPPATVHLLRPNGMGCPAGLTAERQASGQREWVVSLEDAAQSPRPEAMWKHSAGVRVEVTGWTGKAIRQAEVEVDYTAPGIRVVSASEVGAASNGLPDSGKTFVLSAVAGKSNFTLAGDLLVGNAGSITRVRLLRLDYFDGSEWRTSGESRCAVEPGLFLAVASR